MQIFDNNAKSVAVAAVMAAARLAESGKTFCLFGGVRNISFLARVQLFVRTRLSLI